MRTLRVACGDTVFVAMGKQGLQLPSNCGGGQSCGLCEVKVCGNVPAATPADRAQLSLAKLRDGHRLACNLPVTSDLEIEVLGGVELWSQHGARVESVNALSPTLREVVLLPDERADAAYRPGSYIQVIVPALPDVRGADRTSRSPPHRMGGLAPAFELGEQRAAAPLLFAVGPGRADRWAHQPAGALPPWTRPTRRTTRLARARPICTG
ncbi:2Fe-2S iron-sulfur cluster-binding protein [Paucibacter sp. O1-1]|nr:2Fe-2S iron-sulfur cluster-binding protein [Paucibacter sp. O1-1]MDA3824758.1 2Fe-2S iron-sulfur cluster-binding protein [Paucibacter sp. O1-1]